MRYTTTNDICYVYDIMTKDQKALIFDPHNYNDPQKATKWKIVKLSKLEPLEYTPPRASIFSEPFEEDEERIFDE